MSETVHYKGILTKVERLEGETLEAQCKRLLGDQALPTYFDSYAEFLLDNYYKSMTIQEGVVYEVAKIEMDGDSDIFNAGLRADGQIEFDIRYYNGGCGFDEAIEKAMKTIEKKRVTKQPLKSDERALKRLSCKRCDTEFYAKEDKWKDVSYCPVCKNTELHGRYNPCQSPSTKVEGM